jgi:hypothetical protein
MAQHIVNWSIERLIPLTRNPRTHSDAQVAQIAASIAEFGFNNSILETSGAARVTQIPLSQGESRLNVWMRSFGKAT